MTGWAPGQIGPGAHASDLQPSSAHANVDRQLAERLRAASAERVRDGALEARFWSRRGPLEGHAVAVRETPAEPPAEQSFEPLAVPGRAVPSPPGVGRVAVEAAFAGSPGLDWALRVSWCESSFNPGAYNPYSGASGLFQFLEPTWRTTPFAGASVFDPAANAQAARWMYEHGRAGEWSCR